MICLRPLIVSGALGVVAAGPATADASEIMLEFHAATSQFSVALQDMDIVHDPAGGGQMHYQMTGDDRSGFMAFTETALGERVVTSVCDTVLSEAVIMAQIDSGVFVHTIPEADLADAIVAMATDGAECAGIERE
ncbi:hypothetical protein [Roseinatronobacter monicus]|uniref:Uncharacterized protein n=1 Tax=Roseinatronobacter monicus TaxID=393481 RepID=A0A543KDS0_9RHOB|nr:hypothetical protein [Roseinatronobacter monicus]TQM93219.1 hypothetical protein BD293_1849 [Roseinatronobacter monicus]